MDENITTIILLDETETLGRIKPFHCTFFHFSTPLYTAPPEPLNKNNPIAQPGRQALLSGPKQQKPHNR
jgi:hypothetical protein